MSLLSQLIGLLPSDDPDDDWVFDDTTFDRITEATEALIAGADRALIPDLEAHLASCLRRGDFFGRDVIGEVLAGIAGPDALPTLLRAATQNIGDDQDTFLTIVTDLLVRDSERARPVVLDLVDSSDAALRATGVWALDFLVADDDLPRLTAALDDSDPGVRIRALGALGFTRDPAALPDISRLAADPDARVRRWAGIAAERLGSAPPQP